MVLVQRLNSACGLAAAREDAQFAACLCCSAAGGVSEPESEQKYTHPSVEWSQVAIELIAEKGWLRNALAIQGGGPGH